MESDVGAPMKMHRLEDMEGRIDITPAAVLLPRRVLLHDLRDIRFLATCFHCTLDRC